MYTQVAYALAVTEGTEAFSQAVSLSGANGVGVDATVINQGTDGTLDVNIEVSNDLANWEAITIGTTGMIEFGANVIGYKSAQYPDSSADRIGFEYIRLRYTQGETGTTSIVSAGINVFEA